MRRRDPRPRDLTSLGVQPLRGDLRSVLIKPHHDRHRTASSLAKLARTNTARGRMQAYRPTRTAPLHMPSIKSRRRSSAATGDTAIAGQTTWSTATIESQPAAAREPTDRAGRHRPTPPTMTVTALSVRTYCAPPGGSSRSGGVRPQGIFLNPRAPQCCFWIKTTTVVAETLPLFAFSRGVLKRAPREQCEPNRTLGPGSRSARNSARENSQLSLAWSAAFAIAAVGGSRGHRTRSTERAECGPTRARIAWAFCSSAPTCDPRP